MKKSLARIIVRHRTAILAAVMPAAVLSTFQIGRTRINYDLTRYLSDDTMTQRALTVMNAESGSSGIRRRFPGSSSRDRENNRIQNPA